MIHEQAKVCQAIGYDQLKNDEAHDLNVVIDGVEQDTCLDFAVQLNEDPLSCQSDLVEHVRVADIMLSEAFNFYNFSVRLNIEERNEIQNQNYIRFYKLKIEQLLKD